MLLARSVQEQGVTHCEGNSHMNDVTSPKRAHFSCVDQTASLEYTKEKNHLFSLIVNVLVIGIATFKNRVAVITRISF